MKKIVIGVVVALVMLFVVVPPASAGLPCHMVGVCGQITHYKYDSGLNSPFLIRCNFNRPATNHILGLGVSSSKYCSDADQVYVYPGQEIWCSNVSRGERVWYKAWDATGWHQFHDTFQSTCVIQSD